MTAACGRDLSLWDDPDTEAGFATMTANGNSYYDSLNLWFLKQACDRPSDDIHLLLSGQTNIREVMAFPKTQSGSDPMLEAPSAPEPQQYEELGLRFVGLPPKPSIGADG